MASADPGFGLVLFDRDLSSDTLAAVGTGTYDSVYTEAGPGPGVPVADAGSTWRPAVAGAQTVALDVRTLRGGYPGREGASIVYRLATDTLGSDVRSWQDPVLVTGWSAPPDGWGGSSTFDQYAATVIDETGLVIITAVDTGTGDAFTWSWDPVTDTWTTLYDWGTGTGDGLVTPIAHAYDPAGAPGGGGRLYLWSGTYTGSSRQTAAYYSDDGGETWGIYARDHIDHAVTSSIGTGGGTFPTTGSAHVVRGAGGDLDWLMILHEDTSDLGFAVTPSAYNGIQAYSADAGVSWTAVSVAAAGAPGPGQAVRGPAGLVYVYVDPSDSDYLKAAYATSASAGFSGSTTISATGYSGVWACADTDGTLYAISRGAAGAATVGTLRVWRSTDGGLTWTTYAWGALDTASSTQYFDPRLAFVAAGRVHVVGTTIGNTSTDGTVQVLSFGGWSQVAHGPGRSNNIATPIHRHGYGAVDATATGAWSAGYIPISAPGNVGWTAVIATGTANLGPAPGLNTVTTAGQGQIYRKTAATNATYAAYDAIVKAAPASATLATIGTGEGAQLLCVLQSTGSAYQYLAAVDVGSDGLQVRDVNGGPAIRASASFDTTAAPVAIRAFLTRGAAWVWYSVDGGVVWTALAEGVTLTDGGAAVLEDGVYFGNNLGVAGDVTWYFVGAAGAADWQYGLDGVAAVGDSPATGPMGHQFGRSVPGRGGHVVIPEGAARDAGEELPRVSASGGPTYVGETVSLPVGYTYGVDHIDPIVSPSPRRRWTATDDEAVSFVWDAGVDQESYHGGALALLVVGAPRYWALQHDDGAGGWTTLGTLDLAVGSGLTWARSGRVVIPGTGTTTIARKIAEDELVGGTFDLDGDCRTILHNSAGFWTDASTVQRVTLTLDGVTGAEAVSGSAGVLCAPGGLLVAHLAAHAARRYVRAGAVAAQATPDGVYYAGAIAVGRVVGLSPPTWNWTSSTGLVRRTTTAADGVTTATELGPAPRTWTYSWARTPLLVPLSLSAVPDRYAAGGGASIGAEGNAPLDLPGLVARLESGAIPCVVVPVLPTSTASTTNPRMFLFGRVGASGPIAGVSGVEGTSEIVSGPTLTVTELR